MSSSRSAPLNLVNSAGKPIILGSLLGRGGEGAVYALSASDSVVKVYHDPIKQAKQQKLKAMVQGQAANLLRIATWPVDTAHDARTRTMVGFIMPKLSGFKEIHTLYSPAQRKQEYPDADWAFLVQAARNAAAAIGTFHSMGHVVGDINPKNLVVSKDAMIKLIDSDSFQIHASGGPYLCEVGVPHFTPPELHGKALDKTLRSANHDSFGLALLCFHLLFMGRHPYAGKYRNGTADMSIEKAIREFRFAYGPSAAIKQMAPPPNAPTMALVPNRMQQMFELAFGQEGSWGKRPSAAAWVQELTALQQSLITCNVMSSHKYPRTLSACPWCSFETSAGVSFFIYTARSSLRITFDVDAVWATIQAIIAPGPAQLPNLTYGMSAQPFVLPSGITLKQSIDLYRQESKLRRASVASATQQLAQAQNLWTQHIADKGFEQKHSELRQTRDKCQAILSQYHTERKQHEQQAIDLQLREYLKKYFIERAKINGIGSTRAATLASYGIETAADIIQSQILGIPGFGPTLTQELLKWRRGLETNFKYNPGKIVQHHAVTQLDLLYAAKLTPYRKALEAGTGELEKLRQDTLARRQQLIQDLKQCSMTLNQAEADLTYLLAELRAAQRHQITEWLDQRKILLMQAKTRLSHIGAKLHVAQYWARKASDARKRKFIAQVVISIIITGCLLAVIAFTDIRTWNLGYLFNDWQVTRATPIIQQPPTLVPQATQPRPTPISPLPEPIPGKTIIGTTTIVSRMYEMPRPDSKMIQDIPHGTEVTIIGRSWSSVWCKAQVANGLEGWVYCLFLMTHVPVDSVPVIPVTNP